MPFVSCVGKLKNTFLRLPCSKDTDSELDSASWMHFRGIWKAEVSRARFLIALSLATGKMVVKRLFPCNSVLGLSHYHSGRWERVIEAVAGASSSLGQEHTHTAVFLSLILPLQPPDSHLVWKR